MKEIKTINIIGMGAPGLLFGQPIRENLWNGQPAEEPLRSHGMSRAS